MMYFFHNKHCYWVVYAYLIFCSEKLRGNFMSIVIAGLTGYVIPPMTSVLSGMILLIRITPFKPLPVCTNIKHGVAAVTGMAAFDSVKVNPKSSCRESFSKSSFVKSAGAGGWVWQGKSKL
ncbi:MAG: hypothetical protein ACLTZT_18770 [Butyricimonas faecalis]